MAATTFGAPMDEEPDKPVGENGGQSAPIDMNDPALMSEQLDIDTAADAYAIPPPPPDGKWRAKLKIVDIKDADGQAKQFRAARFDSMNDGKPFFVVNVEASLIDVGGKFDGIKAIQYWVKSQVDRRKNIDEMSTITKAAGGQVVARGTHADRLAALQKALAGEPEVIVETHWDAQCQSCQEAADKKGERKPKAFKIGMHNFPQPSAGKYDPMVSCPTCHSSCRAQLRIGGFYNVKEMKATRGIA